MCPCDICIVDKHRRGESKNMQPPIVRAFLIAALWIVPGDVNAYAFAPRIRPVAFPGSGSGEKRQGLTVWTGVRRVKAGRIGNKFWDSYLQPRDCAGNLTGRVGGCIVSLRGAYNPGNQCPSRTPKATAEGASDADMKPSDGGSGEQWYTCRNCKQRFQRKSNTEGSCSFHPGLFSGRLNRVNDVDTSGLEYFWSCCGETDASHPGCVVGRHVSYDDPPEGEGGWRSPLTGVLRS